MAEEAPDSDQRRPPRDIADASQAAASPIHVFVSYASQDAAIADVVVTALERRGLKCWIAPRDVTPGDFYAGAIVHAIDAAKATVLILSKNAADSPHVIREVERAASRRRPVISLRIDQVDLPADLEYFLNTSQWLEASGSDIARSMPRLANAVCLAIEKSAIHDTAIEAPATEGGPAPTSSPTIGRSRHRAALAVGILVVVAVAGFAAYRLWLPGHRAAAPPVATDSAAAASAIAEKSVAVLPFVDMSEKKDQGYFADGMTEELINHLAEVPDLKVIARTSSFQFKGMTDDVRTIAVKLAVAHLLEGSVRKSGKVLRITAQLIRAKDGSHLWSKSYERRLDDVFKVQDEIAASVTQALQVAMRGEEATPIRKQPNSEAYSLVLEGNFYKARMNAADMERAIRLYLRAIKVDPDYALPWARLGSAHFNQAMNAWIPRNQGIEKARRELQQALKIDPNLVWAHYTLCGMAMAIDWDWDEAEAQIEQVRQIDSNSYLLPSATADLASIRGQLDRAITIYQGLVSRDPLDANSLASLASLQFVAKRFDESRANSERLIELSPNYAGAQTQLAVALIYLGRPDQALLTAEKETDENSRLDILPIIYWALGRHGDSDVALAKLEATQADDCAYCIAQALAYRGEVASAFTWLERAFGHREAGITSLKTDLLLANLVGDPRYRALLVRMRLAP